MARSRESFGDFLNLLLTVTERVSTITRLVRAEKELFKILVEEKRDESKNEKFTHDFKTLADVVIQAAVKYHVGKLFPQIKDHIFGEESDTFTNGLGETIIIQLGDSEQETVSLLSKVLEGHDQLAQQITKAIYEPLPAILSLEMARELEELEVDLMNIGVWIDPIDNTNEYVGGFISKASQHDIHLNGLHGVTILIGAFDRTTGDPLVGVVGQPFWNMTSNKVWTGRTLWGFDINGKKMSSIPPVSDKKDKKSPLCVMSASSLYSNAALIQALSDAGYQMQLVCGCGYKLLCVIDGLADVFIQTGSSSYRWDTCGPHAILRSLGGSVEAWSAAVGRPGEKAPLVYHRPDDELITDEAKKWRNTGGFFAYASLDIRQSVLDTLATS